MTFLRWLKDYFNGRCETCIAKQAHPSSIIIIDNFRSNRNGTLMGTSSTGEGQSIQSSNKEQQQKSKVPMFNAVNWIFLEFACNLCVVSSSKAFCVQHNSDWY